MTERASPTQWHPSRAPAACGQPSSSSSGACFASRSPLLLPFLPLCLMQKQSSPQSATWAEHLGADCSQWQCLWCSSRSTGCSKHRSSALSGLGPEWVLTLLDRGGELELTKTGREGALFWAPRRCRVETVLFKAGVFLPKPEPVPLTAPRASTNPLPSVSSTTLSWQVQ